MAKHYTYNLGQLVHTVDITSDSELIAALDECTQYRRNISQLLRHLEHKQQESPALDQYYYRRRILEARAKLGECDKHIEFIKTALLEPESPQPEGNSQPGEEG